MGSYWLSLSLILSGARFGCCPSLLKRSVLPLCYGKRGKHSRLDWSSKCGKSHAEHTRSIYKSVKRMAPAKYLNHSRGCKGTPLLAERRASGLHSSLTLISVMLSYLGGVFPSGTTKNGAGTLVLFCCVPTLATMTGRTGRPKGGRSVVVQRRRCGAKRSLDIYHIFHR